MAVPRRRGYGARAAHRKLAVAALLHDKVLQRGHLAHERNVVGVRHTFWLCGLGAVPRRANFSSNRATPTLEWLCGGRRGSICEAGCGEGTQACGEGVARPEASAAAPRPPSKQVL